MHTRQRWRPKWINRILDCSTACVRVCAVCSSKTCLNFDPKQIFIWENEKKLSANTQMSDFSPISLVGYPIRYVEIANGMVNGRVDCGDMDNLKRCVRLQYFQHIRKCVQTIKFHITSNGRKDRIPNNGIWSRIRCVLPGRKHSTASHTHTHNKINIKYGAVEI